MSDFQTTFIIQSKDGQIDWGSPFNEARFREWLRLHPGKRLRIQPIKEYRTGSQNNYYWLYLDIISMETGNDASELHEFFKRTLLPAKKVRITGKKKIHEFERETSTTELTKTEFGEYLDKICALVGVPLPDPKEAGYITNY